MRTAAGRALSGVHAVLESLPGTPAPEPPQPAPGSSPARRLAGHDPAWKSWGWSPRSIGPAAACDSWRTGRGRGAGEALDAFLDEVLCRLPANAGLSRPGRGRRGCRRTCILARSAPRQVWRRVRGRRARPVPAATRYLRELGWREFAHHLLYHFPHTPEQPLRHAVRRVSLGDRRRATCGPGSAAAPAIPIVDAGMRELWHTGWMHNRVRMIVGLVPDQGPADPLAGGRALVLGHAGRCRPGQQHAGLAVGRRLRRRRRALFPHLQSGEPGRRSSTPPAPTSGAGCRSWTGCRMRGSTSPGRLPPACWPRRGSSWGNPIRGPAWTTAKLVPAPGGPSTHQGFGRRMR